MKKVVFGMLGSTLDAGKGAKRWEKWRPTVAMCRHDDIVIDRLELLYQEKFAGLCDLVVSDIREVSPETAVVTHKTHWSDPWDLEEVYGDLLDFVRGYKFRPAKEEYLFHITTGTHIAQISSFLLTEARYFPGKILQTSPPGKGGRGEPGTFRVIDLDLSRYDQLAQRFRVEQKAGLSALKSGIDTRNKKFNALIAQIERVAISSSDPMLLTGPTGAGKSQLATRIYELKKARRNLEGPFVDVNCATIRGDSAMSALFGHVKGAFTGAAAARDGYLRNAHRGVLFLDEIGELGLDEQAMLLRAIEEKSFFPVGADKQVQSDFQLIAGTNRDLLTEVSFGRFRADLLARIDLWSYALPSLAERREDIEPNLEYELLRARESFGENITMSREAKKRFLTFAAGAPWLGNFRDLNGAVRRMATLCEGGRISVADVDEETARLTASWKRGAAPASNILTRYIEDPLGLDDFDRAQLEHVLQVCESSRSMADAGKRLFAVSRARKKTSNDSDRIRKYLGRFGISWTDIVA